LTKGQLALFAKEARQNNSSKKTTKTNSNNKWDSLRARLTTQLVTGKAECMVCLDKIKPVHATWDCQHCYQVFHIHCIKKWVKSQREETSPDGGWRCPGCQNLTKSVPKEYRCFCRKTVDPQYDRRETPHSCGEVCNKSLKPANSQDTCPHSCKDLCHPGPCAPCTASVSRSCPCGKTKQMLKCTADLPICENQCQKVLNCGEHKCLEKCHQGACKPCTAKIVLACHCDRRQVKTMDCNEETNAEVAQLKVKGRYSCGQGCQKQLKCRVSGHTCAKTCHPGACGPCPLSPETVKFCPCGQTPVKGRISCEDPVPTCGQTCNKKLSCGPVGKNHRCKHPCHSGECPPCDLTTEVQCRCGKMDKEMDCKDLASRTDDARCDFRCNKKRNCGKHKCGRVCCIDIDHVCQVPCNKLLTCGQHRCQDYCHRGNCALCPNVSFEELRCHCGTEVTYPPVHCGTVPPPCTRTCTRDHSCSHEVRHNCHADEQCPPCTTLTEKHCYGKHELRKSVFCHLEGLSCGRPCGKDLPCGRHRCLKPCHNGPCQTAATPNACNQPCTIPREDCGHRCGAPCHDGPCNPKAPCQERMKVKCACGNLSRVVICSENEREYQRIRTSQLAAQMFRSNDDGGSSTLSTNDFSGSIKGSGNKVRLDCNEECSQLERNRRMALALQIENPDVSNKTTPKYSESLKDLAKRDPFFARAVHNAFAELVIKTKKQASLMSCTHEFGVMGREKRQFVHELAAFFGCATQSFDPEPKRNVVATATKGEVWLPTISVVEVAQGVVKRAAPKL